MTEVDKFLADISVEGDDAFADIGEKAPAESQTEKEPKETPEEGMNTPEDNIPFHKHPRWIEREGELKTLRETAEENAKEIAELKSIRTEKEPTAIPEWFKE